MPFPPDNQRLLTGLIDGSAGVVTGTDGFTANKAGNVPGFVQVRYTEPFLEFATVVATLTSPDAFNGNVTIRSQDREQFTVQLTDLDSVNQDHSFSFIVIGR